jgi:hypothetical protein
MKSIYCFIFFYLLAPSVSAETIWCKMLGKGCLTQEQFDKQSLYCQKNAAKSRADAFNEALANPSVWQLGGYSSAQEYAEARRRLSLSVCFKTSNPHQF